MPHLTGGTDTPAIPEDLVFRVPEGTASLDREYFSRDDCWEEVILPPGCTGIEKETFLPLKRTLRRVTLPEDMTRLPDKCFHAFRALEEVHLPASLRAVPPSAFAGCCSLRRIDLPEGLKVIGNHAFSWCTALKEVTVPSSVLNICGEAFCCCTSLESVCIPAPLLSGSGGAFSGCTALRRVELSHWQSELSPFMFQSCISLKQFSFPGNLQIICRLALSGTSLEEADLPEGLLTIEPLAFRNCTRLVRLRLPASLRDFSGSALAGCTALQEVSMPEGGSCLREEDGLIFRGNTLCGGLVPRDGVLRVPDSVTEIQYGAFRESGVVSLFLPAGLKRIDEDAFCGCRRLKEVFFRSCPSMEDAFRGSSPRRAGWLEPGPCLLKVSALPFQPREFYAPETDLQDIPDALRIPALRTFAADTGEGTWPEEIRASYVRSLKARRKALWSDPLFLPCLLRERCIPPGELEECLREAEEREDREAAALLLEGRNRYFTQEELDRAAEKKLRRTMRILDTGRLPLAELRKQWSWENVESGVRITSCRCLEGDVQVPDRFGNRVPVTLGRLSFSPEQPRASRQVQQARSSPREVHIPEGVRVIEGEAFLSSGTVHVTLPESLQEIGESAFRGCSSLRKIRLPRGITVIRNWTFQHCGSLTEAVLPDTLVSIGERAFQDCSLHDLELPDRLETVERNAFRGCTRLHSVRVGSGIQFIDSSAFLGCSMLVEVTLPAAALPWEKIFSWCPLKTVRAPDTPGARKLARLTGAELVPVPAA